MKNIAQRAGGKYVDDHFIRSKLFLTRTVLRRFFACKCFRSCTYVSETSFEVSELFYKMFLNRKKWHFTRSRANLTHQKKPKE